MQQDEKLKYLKIALIVFGVIFIGHRAGVGRHGSPNTSR